MLEAPFGAGKMRDPKVEYGPKVRYVPKFKCSPNVKYGPKVRYVPKFKCSPKVKYPDMVQKSSMVQKTSKARGLPAIRN